jgi:hypothetical protein
MYIHLSPAKKGRQSAAVTDDIDNTVFGELVGKAGIFLKTTDDSQDEIGTCTVGNVTALYE